MTQFRPRWYYILVNKTSGKKYVGQTVRESMDEYAGSGGYWKAHCKKHGGWDRSNVEVIQQVWLESKEEAQKWLDAFAAENDGYWLNDNVEWANVCKETTEDSAFAGNKEIQSKAGKIGGKKNVESGHLARIASAGGKIGGKKAAESGQLASVRTKESCSAGGKIGGKTAGKIAVESGHLARIRTKEFCSAGGKAAGKIAVESGQWAKRCSAGGKTAGKKRGEGMKLMSQFCKVFGITSPGNNYVNIDKSSFQAWKESLSQEQKNAYLA
jgi:hypothetical protein